MVWVPCVPKGFRKHLDKSVEEKSQTKKIQKCHCCLWRSPRCKLLEVYPRENNTTCLQCYYCSLHNCNCLLLPSYIVRIVKLDIVSEMQQKAKILQAVAQEAPEMQISERRERILMPNPVTRGL